MSNLKIAVRQVRNIKKDDELPIKLPDTGIVTNSLELGRLFKPLKREVKSRTVQELNVKETVKKSAELSTQKRALHHCGMIVNFASSETPNVKGKFFVYFCKSSLDNATPLTPFRRYRTEVVF